MSNPLTAEELQNFRLQATALLSRVPTIYPNLCKNTLTLVDEIERLNQEVDMLSEMWNKAVDMYKLTARWDSVTGILITIESEK